MKTIYTLFAISLATLLSGSVASGATCPQEYGVMALDFGTFEGRLLLGNQYGDCGGAPEGTGHQSVVASGGNPGSYIHFDGYNVYWRPDCGHMAREGAASVGRRICLPDDFTDVQFSTDYNVTREDGGGADGLRLRLTVTTEADWEAASCYTEGTPGDWYLNPIYFQEFPASAGWNNIAIDSVAVSAALAPYAGDTVVFAVQTFNEISGTETTGKLDNISIGIGSPGACPQEYGLMLTDFGTFEGKLLLGNQTDPNCPPSGTGHMFVVPDQGETWGGAPYSDTEMGGNPGTHIVFYGYSVHGNGCGTLNREGAAAVGKRVQLPDNFDGVNFGVDHKMFRKDSGKPGGLRFRMSVTTEAEWDASGCYDDGTPADWYLNPIYFESFPLPAEPAPAEWRHDDADSAALIAALQPYGGQTVVFAIQIFNEISGTNTVNKIDNITIGVDACTPCAGISDGVLDDLCAAFDTVPPTSGQEFVAKASALADAALAGVDLCDDGGPGSGSAAACKAHLLSQLP